MENRVEDSIGREFISFRVYRGLLGSNIFVFLVNFSASLFSEFKFIFTWNVKIVHIFMSISHSPKLPKLTNIIFHLSVTIKTGLGKRFVVFNILRVLIASSDSLSSISDGHNGGQMVTCLRCGMVNSCHVSQCDNHKSFFKKSPMPM